MAGGRPSKLNDDVCEEIVKSIKEGIPPATASQLSGITKRTYENWIKRGKEAKRKNKYSEFFRRVEGAKAFASKKHLHRIMESKDWKAQKYLLTLLYPDIYNAPDKIEVKADVNSENNHNITIESRLERLKRIEQEHDNQDNTSTDL